MSAPAQPLSVAAAMLPPVHAPSLIVGLLLGALLGAAVVMLARRPVDRDAVAARHEADLVRVRAEGAAVAAGLRAEAAAQEATVQGLERQLDASERQAADLAERRRAEDADRRRHEQEEHRVLTALAPVQEALRAVQGKVGDLEQQRAAQYGAIEQQLLATLRTTEQVRGTAESLAAALRNTSVRGAWGETQLRRLVESAGMT